MRDPIKVFLRLCELPDHRLNSLIALAAIAVAGLALIVVLVLAN